jgi:putative AdoMet-dependent methyltransferase
LLPVLPPDPFPVSDFDTWAESYDRDLSALNRFPFEGYELALNAVVRLAAPRADMSVLDIGTGTGNLAVRFAERGCELWCTDFSAAMLERARSKLPTANFVLHDLREAWPPALERRFDRIVSAYVFHHFGLEEKVALCRALVQKHLAPSGKLVVADLSFPDSEAMNRFAESVGELWEAEPYWLARESVAALQDAGLNVTYEQISKCAGVYCVEAPGARRARNESP